MVAIHQRERGEVALVLLVHLRAACGSAPLGSLVDGALVKHPRSSEPLGLEISRRYKRVHAPHADAQTLRRFLGRVHGSSHPFIS